MRNIPICFVAIILGFSVLLQGEEKKQTIILFTED